MGIFAVLARDFHEFRSQIVEFWSIETEVKLAKARIWRAFSAFCATLSWIERPPGWGGRIRTSAWGNQNPLPYHLATPQSACRKSGGRSPRGFLRAMPVYRESGAISTCRSRRCGRQFGIRQLRG